MSAPEFWRRPGGCASALAALGLLAAGSGQAAEPRSAIPWLSESIQHVAAPPARPSTGPIRPGAPAADDTISVTPLPAINRDAIGLLPPDSTGFTRRLWDGQSAEAVRDEILDTPGTGVPEARALFQRVLLAEADPPTGSDADTSVLIARLDRLLDMGALEKAAALVEAAGPDTPDLFRRWFDTGLLLGRAAEPCAALRQNPSLSPTLPARVFCLARGGDWGAAEITLTLGQQLGQIEPDQQALLARFLDPELFEEAEEPPIPEPLTPLDFLMREAVGLPRPPGSLPNAFLVQDLTEHTPMRMRIEAAERLTLTGALDGGLLLAAYRSGEPAASGGVWDRAAAVQNLDAAFDVSEAPDGSGPTAASLAANLAASLAIADAALGTRGLRVVLARGYADRLAGIDPAGWSQPDRNRLAELLLLGGRTDAAAAVPDTSPAVATALAIASGDTAPEAPSELARFAVAGLTAGDASDDRERHLANLVASGRQGEALLEAITLVAAGPAVDPQGLRAALLTLRLAGQEPAARTLAIQTLLAEATR